MRDFMKAVLSGALGVGVVLAGVVPALALPATLSTEDPDGRVNLRSGPSIQSRVLEQLATGGGIEVLNISRSRNGDYWYYVRSEIEGTEEGWIRSDFARLKVGDRRYGMLIGQRGDQVNVRSAPSTQSQVLHRGMAGDVVLVQRDRQGEKGYKWYAVEFPDGEKGWVREDVVSVWPKGCVITCSSQ